MAHLGALRNLIINTSAPMLAPSHADWPSDAHSTPVERDDSALVLMPRNGNGNGNGNVSDCEGDEAGAFGDPFDVIRQKHPELVMFSFVFDTIIIGSLCVFGILGNGISFVVLQHDHTSTTTSYFLQVLSVVQTVLLAGSLMQFSLRSVHMYLDPEPTEFLYYYFHNFYLHAVGYLWSLAMFAQTLMNWIVLVISIERFLVVRRPLDAPNWCSMRIAKWTSAVLSIAAFVFNIPRWFEWEVFEYYDECASEDADAAYRDSRSNGTTAPNTSVAQQPTIVISGDGYLRQIPTYNYAYRIVAYFLFVAGGPLILLIILNVLLIEELQTAALSHVRFNNSVASRTPSSPIQQRDAAASCKHTNLKATNSNSNNLLDVKVSKLKASKQHKLFTNQSNYSRLIVVVVLTFVVCQAPAFVHQVFAAIGMTVHEYEFIVYTTIVSNTLVVANCSLNFLVYCAYSKKFRLLVKRMLVRCRRRRRRAAARAHATPLQPGTTQPQRTPGTVTTAPTAKQGTAGIRIELSPAMSAPLDRKHNKVLCNEKLLIAYSSENNSPVFRITVPQKCTPELRLDDRLKHCLRPPSDGRLARSNVASPVSSASVRSTTPLITPTRSTQPARLLVEMNEERAMRRATELARYDIKTQTRL